MRPVLLLAAAIPPSALAMAWLDHAVVAGAGGLWLATVVLLGGIAIRLRQGRAAATCARGPRLRPLQASCLGAMALGVQLLRAGDGSALLAAFPMLAASWLPAACILGGVGGLGILSITSDCRDEALSRPG